MVNRKDGAGITILAQRCPCGRNISGKRTGWLARMGRCCSFCANGKPFHTAACDIRNESTT